MWQYTHTDELYHYGVLGMKWGQRRARRYNTQAKRLESKIDAKKAKGKLLRGTDGNKIVAAANLRSRAKDLSSNQKVSMRDQRKHSKTAATKAFREGQQYNRDVRAARKANSIAKKKAKEARISQDSKEVAAIRKKRVKEMSNEELKKVNKRLEMETKYKELSGKKNVGKAVVQTVIATGTTIAALETAGRTYKRVGKYAVDRFKKKK